MGKTRLLVVVLASAALLAAAAFGLLLLSVNPSPVARGEGAPAAVGLASPLSLGSGGGLALTLVPSPDRGGVPMSVSVTAAMSGGVAPYTLSVCFSIQDHSSQTPDCAPVLSGWSGGGPVAFTHLYSQPGYYSVLGIGSDARGSSVGSTALIVVTSGPALNAVVTESTSSGSAPLIVSFNATLSGGNPPDSIQWSFGDGSLGSGLPGVPVSHQYASEGQFVPQLTVSDSSGHLVVQALPSIQVSAPVSAPFWGTLATASNAAILLASVGVALVALAAAAVMVRYHQLRRWRREGSAMVEELSQGPSSPPPSTPPP